MVLFLKPNRKLNQRHSLINHHHLFNRFNLIKAISHRSLTSHLLLLMVASQQRIMVIVRIAQHLQEALAFNPTARQLEMIHNLPMILLLKVAIHKVETEILLLSQLAQLSLLGMKVAMDNLQILIQRSQQVMIHKDPPMELRRHQNRYRRRLMMRRKLRMKRGD